MKIQDRDLARAAARSAVRVHTVAVLKDRARDAACGPFSLCDRLDILIATKVETERSVGAGERCVVRGVLRSGLLPPVPARGAFRWA